MFIHIFLTATATAEAAAFIQSLLKKKNELLKHFHSDHSTKTRNMEMIPKIMDEGLQEPIGLICDIVGLMRLLLWFAFGLKYFVGFPCCS